MQTTLFMREHLEVVPGLVDCLPCIPGSVRFVGESCLQDDSDRHIDSFIVANCCSCKGYEFQPRVDLVTQGLDTAVKTPVGFHIQMVFFAFLSHWIVEIIRRTTRQPAQISCLGLSGGLHGRPVGWNCSIMLKPGLLELGLYYMCRKISYLRHLKLSWLGDDPRLSPVRHRSTIWDSLIPPDTAHSSTGPT